MKILHPDRYEKWSTILADWESTDLSVAAYCREHSIRRWKLPLRCQPWVGQLLLRRCALIGDVGSMITSWFRCCRV